MNLPHSPSLPSSLPREARLAAIAGTRALVADETLSALVALLIGSGTIPADDVRATVVRLADKLSGYAGGHDEFQVHPVEIEANAQRLRKIASDLC